MNLQNLLAYYSETPYINKIETFFNTTTKGKYNLTGCIGSALSLIVAAYYKKTLQPIVLVLPEKETAAYYYNDLVNILSEQHVYFFPSSYKQHFHQEHIDSSNIALRTEVLKHLYTNQKLIVITYPDALAEKIINRSDFEKNTLHLHKGEKVSQEFICDVLYEYNFILNDFVYEPGQFARRGSIIDMFSFSSDHPYRIDFNGDTIESIRTFDIETQLSIETLDKASIIPNLIPKQTKNNLVSFFEFISEQSTVIINNTKFFIEQLNLIFESVPATCNNTDEKLSQETITSGNQAYEQLEKFNIVEIGSPSIFNAQETWQLSMSVQPVFNKNFALLADTLVHYQEQGFINYILSNNEKQFKRLKNIFCDIKKEVVFTPIQNILHAGFIDNERKICCFTDHQIFDRFHKYKLKTEHFKNQSSIINDISGLHIGDYVVHIDHGIGIFGGLEKIEQNGKLQEAIKLIYKDNDILYVNIHSLHRIAKYKAKDSTAPKIYKLGSGAWQKLKNNTKQKVKDIAKELITLYSQRKATKGFSFSHDTYLQEQLEASFIYEDTPDQEKATKLVKQAMEANYPMDMLVCGDVGFGKTEVAIRAAFKAIADNKQVAVLVPTTILALQHYNTFSERLKNFPCTIDYISRLKKAKQQTETLKNLALGKIDIIIGTHRLLSKDISFKELGLLIIDEEQKFGVAAKEKLKQLKINVDTLTLTATPIPRTLQFSLMGARDLAIINTPPPNRFPIITSVHTFSPDLIAQAIEYEVTRNGQVFFIHNRIQNIFEIQTLINTLCPKIKTAVAHGQMDGEQLEQIMLDFINGNFDVLIATSIIESGLDIPNANTIIINDAHNFGLSDLHQLRGRVGRSNKKAFCYLLAPPFTLINQEARRRLTAIEQFSELGSGINIALQDLDIRGAGNLLGAEQSGFIADIGFETYQRILEEAMLEIKQDELIPEHTEENIITEPINETNDFVSDCIIDTDLELLFPDEYIDSISERIKLYRELDAIKTDEELCLFEKQLNDRFGELPNPTKELLNVVTLRKKAKQLGFEKIVLKNNTMVAYFITNQLSPFYKSQIFSKIISNVSKQRANCRIKESGNKLLLIVEKIINVSDAINFLKGISQ